MCYLWKVMNVRVVCVGEAPGGGVACERLSELPEVPAPRTVYLVLPSERRPKRPFPLLIYEPERASWAPDTYYTPETLCPAQILLAWRTYRMRKWMRKRWRITLLEKAPSIYYFAFDAQGRVVDYNPALEAALHELGLPKVRRGMSTLQLVFPENQASFAQELAFVQEGHSVQVQRQIGPRQAEVCILPLNRRQREKTIYGYYALDATLYHQLVEATLAQQRLQENILASLPEGVVVLDAQDRIQYLNSAAETLLSAPLVEWLGKPFHFPLQGGTFVHKDRILCLDLVPLEASKGRLCVLQDKTPLWQAERFSQLFRILVQSGSFGVLIFQEGPERQLISFYQNPLGAAWLQKWAPNYFDRIQQVLKKADRTALQKALSEKQKIQLELRAPRKKYGWSHLSLNLFPVEIDDPAIKCTYWIAILQDQTELYQLLRRQQRLEQLQNQLILEAQERERQRLAEELHDNVGMLLSVLKMEVSALLQDATEECRFRDRLGELLQRLDEVTQAVRLTSHQLMPPLVEHFGLLPSLEGLIRRAALRSSVEIRFEVRGEPVELPLLKVIQIYRILQELITNTLKHAQAQELYILLHYQRRYLVLEVWDDGKGYSPQGSTGGGIGLQSLAGRLRVLNAHWENLSAPGKGAHYRFEIPLPRKKS